MIWPVKKVFITQQHGVNGHIYSRFGYKGHNGIDLRLHDGNGTHIYAPHDGVVKERRLDEDGYGYYLKIESDVEGSILAHLEGFAVNINKQVKQGDLVGYGDNTGWSTGPHLHWGYYRHPRDRSNGYGGTIDPQPFIGTIENGDNTPPMSEDIRIKLLDENNIKSEGDVRAAIDAYKRLPVMEKDLDNCKKELEELKRIHESVKKDFQIDLKEAEDKNKIYREFVVRLAKASGANQNIEDVETKITSIIESESELQKRLKDIDDNRPVSGDNWFISLVKFIRAFINYFLDKDGK